MSFRTLSILLAAWPLFFGEAVAEGEKKMNFDLSAKKVVLNDGNTMPVLGLGTYSLPGKCFSRTDSTGACPIIFYLISGKCKYIFGSIYKLLKCYCLW